MGYLTEVPTTFDFESVDVAILPIGAIEQHGPALPVGTDLIKVEEVAKTVRDRGDVIILPSIPVGISKHHRHFPGTLWTDAQTLENYMASMIEGIATHGIKKVVVVNGHGGNIDTIKRAAVDLREREVAFVAQWGIWSSDKVQGIQRELFDMDIGHAGGGESSVMLHVRDDLVDESKLPEAEEQGEHFGFKGEEASIELSWGLRLHGADVGIDTTDFTKTGTTGHPTDATTESGEKIFSAATAELDMFIDWLIAQDIEELWV